MAENHPLRKASILLMSLPEETAADLMSRLDSRQIELVSTEIAKMGEFSLEEQHETLNSFANATANDVRGGGGMQVATSLLERTLGKDAGSLLENVRQSIDTLPFGVLQRIDPQNLLTFIIDEHPQTIALVLCHLPTSSGAEILAGLSTDRQLSVLRRVANMGKTSPEVVKEVERGLESRMSNVMGQSYENAGGVPCVAEILNVVDRATERALLEILAQEDPDLAEEIRRLMFVFEDIVKLSDKDVQTLLKHIETSEWAMAMKGCSDALRHKILDNMSQRAADMLDEEMDYLGPVRASDVEATQRQIVDIVRRLDDVGELTTQAEGEEEAFIH